MTDRPSQAARSLRARASAAQPQEPRRILLVEDDDGDALIVEELLLEAWPQLIIERAVDLGSAVRRLPSDVDCVVLDLGLPDAAGVESLQRIHDADAELPVVVLTGDSDEDRGIESLGAGAQDYLTKGAIDGAALARAIRHSVQRKLAERFARELAILRAQSAENARVQRGLVPRPLLDDPRITVNSAYRPGNRRQVLGGDFFDAVQSAPDCLQVVLGDVCGHGPDEAALGVQLRIAWRTLILAGVPQTQLLGTLDRLMVQERHADHIFTTLASLSIDLSEGTASVALAGHPPPILTSKGQVRLLTEDVGGPPLGLADPPRWRLTDTRLGEDWSLLLYSDGIYEGRVAGRPERLGIGGLLGVLADAPGGSREYGEYPERLIDRTEEINQGPLVDDVALLSVTYHARAD
jgi:serine phosphatase RsbU (regulator of sigma subunit)